MSNSTWSLGFHLRSPRGWLNDPNGLCQFRGSYHFYYQYNPYWPDLEQKAWGLFASEDLVHWHYEGVPIEPSMPEDRSGVYTGCTVVERGAASDGGDRLRAYYTGNVICPGPDHDRRDVSFVIEGREANEITCTSEDGIRFGDKTVLLRNADYPDFCSLHVRDPMVWEQDGALHMILGARDIRDHGLCILYRSDDGLSWDYDHAIRPAYPFGYMWECPNVVRMDDGREYLAVSPQGLPRQHDRWHNLCQAGYFPLKGRILDERTIDERAFVEWDHGHDFYAPQIFRDDSGRRIIVGWMGVFDRAYSSAPDGLDWCHCLTVARELVQDPGTGLLLQRPVRELEQLRGAELVLLAGSSVQIPTRQADVDIRGIVGTGTLTLDDSFQVRFEDGRLGIRYLDRRHAAGRDDRSVPLDRLCNLRVLVDGSAVEVFANDGSKVFASRWFCADNKNLVVRSTFDSDDGHVWEMEDVLADMYATSHAPDLAFPGRKKNEPACIMNP